MATLLLSGVWTTSFAQTDETGEQPTPEWAGSAGDGSTEGQGKGQSGADGGTGITEGNGAGTTGAGEAETGDRSAPAGASKATDDKEDEKKETKPAPDPDRRRHGFGFGSYGRVGVGTDLRGGTPEGVSVVKHGARIVQQPYLEIDTYYTTKLQGGIDLRTVVTMAFDNTLFHYTGAFEARPGLRNVFAEAQATDALSLWIGSRMYRGDQIYLLDFWPLDDLNTVGGGMRYAKGKIDVAAHVGANRLLDPYQYQEDTVPGPGVDEETIVFLDRQRVVGSLKGSYFLANPKEGLGMKVKGYLEVHGIGEGRRLLPDNSEELLPADTGWLLGAQFGAWGYGAGATYTNLFVRYGRGLAAFDELATPSGFGADRKLSTASEFMLGVSSNYDMKKASVEFAGYLRHFKDADVNSSDTDDGWEYVVNVRPHYSVLDSVLVALDLSYQVRFPQGLNPTLGYAADPAIFQIAPMLVYSPFGTGSYQRPHFRFLYRAANLNEGARALYPFDDPRFSQDWVHFLGMQVEWWFNSTYR